MDLIELGTKARELRERFDRINEWIEKNRNTDPNMCEIADCTIDFGTLLTLYNDYFTKVGYPMLADGTQGTHYNIASFVPEVRDTFVSLKKMRDMRSGSEAFFEPILLALFAELDYRCYFGEYDVPEDLAIAKIKKDTICTAVSAYFYIWQVKRNEPDYKYDNVSEFTRIKDGYSLYKEAPYIIHTGYFDENGTLLYKGPQFGREIEAMIDGIDKNYLYSDRVNKVDIDSMHM